ncbi:hypothetical protein [Humibacter sp. RRB41]|uniref:hypothetical protein n=1 Tax=Humibacter sp. RRB41 TaxID=2919946 RepID=UPI001FAAD61A|nr:hypothetical protein [Humibacter sp. RRB41]
MSDARALRPPRSPRSPLRVGVFTRAHLNRLAKRDARAGVPRAAYEAEPVGEPTPTVQVLQAHAATYTQREAQRFLTDVRTQWVEHEALSETIVREQHEFAERTSALERAAATAVQDATSPANEDLRRLERRIQRDLRRSAHLKAIIHTRFTVARLRARRYFDYSDEKVALYWGTLRRRHPAAENISDRPPALERPSWLTVDDNYRALDLWNGSTIFSGAVEVGPQAGLPPQQT